MLVDDVCNLSSDTTHTPLGSNTVQHRAETIGQHVRVTGLLGDRRSGFVHLGSGETDSRRHLARSREVRPT